MRIALLASPSLLVGCGPGPADMAPPPLNFTTASGVSLRYRVWGEAARDTLVLIHGEGGWSASWLPPALRTLADSVTLVTFDLRGLGESSAPPDSAGYSIAGAVDDLFGLMDHLGLSAAPVLAHSLGAVVAVHAAVAEPERLSRLILAPPYYPNRAAATYVFNLEYAAGDSLFGREWFAFRDAATRPAEVSARCPELWGIVYRPAYVTDAEVLKEHATAVCGPGPSWVERDTLVRYFLKTYKHDMREMLESISIPLLAIVVENDEPRLREIVEEAAFFSPDARALGFPGPRHYPWVTDPDGFAGAVRTFVDGEWPDESYRPVR